MPHCLDGARGLRLITFVEHFFWLALTEISAFGPRWDMIQVARWSHSIESGARTILQPRPVRPRHHARGREGRSPRKDRRRALRGAVAIPATPGHQRSRHGRRSSGGSAGAGPQARQGRAHDGEIAATLGLPLETVAAVFRSRVGQPCAHVESIRAEGPTDEQFLEAARSAIARRDFEGGWQRWMPTSALVFMARDDPRVRCSAFAPSAEPAGVKRPSR